MRLSQLGTLSATLLAAPVCALHGQRLTPWYTPSAAPFLAAEHATTGGAMERSASICRHSAGVAVALGVVAGAVAGLVAYEVPFGIVIAGEGASSRPFARDLRYSMIAAGAVLGGLWEFARTRGCHSSSAGA